MDCFDNDPFEPSASREEKVDGVHQLLEEGWFFGKLLTRKPRKSSLMQRCYSDLSPNFDQAILAENSPCLDKSSSKKVVGKLTRAPSLPPCIGRREEKIEDIKLTCRQQPIKSTACKEGIQENRRSKGITGQPSKPTLLRTPSLPASMGRDEEGEEDDSDITMSRLIRLAMPPRQTPKGITQSSSIPRCRPPRNWKLETIDTVKESSKETRNQGSSNQRTMQRSLSNLESREVQGFKELGFPGLQGKKIQNRYHQDQDIVRRSPYPSKAWHVPMQSYAPPAPIWAAKGSAQEMKAQLKCWARAVAYNVR